MTHIGDISIIFTCAGVFMVMTGFAHGQSVTLIGPSAIERGRDTVLTCTGGASPYIFIWTDISVNPNVNIFTAGEVSYPREDTKYGNFRVLEAGAGTSTMTIENTQIEDEGRYRCGEGQESDETVLTVEVRYASSLTVASPLENGNTYEATCDALNGRPEVTITWMIGDSGSPCDGTPVETPLTAPTDLLSKRTVCTFQATSDNYEETLRCIISGHQVAGLNDEETFTLNIHNAPACSGIMRVGFQFQDPNLRVSCDIAAADQPNPSISNYYIYYNSTLIHQSSTGVNFVVIPESDFDIHPNFICVAGNYLGNTTSQHTTCNPTGTITPPATLEMTATGMTEGATKEPTTQAKPEPSATEGATKESTTSGTTNPPPPTGEYQVSAGIITLAVLLSGSIIAIISAIPFIVRRRYARSSGKNGLQQVTSSDVRFGSNEANENMAYEMIQSGDRAYTALKLSSSGICSSATIDPANVTFFTKLGSIGRGDFGTVWKGELRSNQGVAAVAIRQIPDNVSESTDVLQSVKILCELSDQPNVVKCMGFCQAQRSIIYEFIFGGTLLTHLQMTGVQSQPTYSNLKPNRVRIDEGSLLNFGWQIAKGMQFLASKKIIHGTLCAHNVLLDERKRCKLSDYGLASSIFSKRGKPTRWSSPETIVSGVQSTEGDIWSFGIVLWEIVTLGARPYPTMTFDIVQKEVTDGYKMPRPRHCGQEVYAIMSLCWEKETRKRSSFDEILKNLERILEKTHNYLSLNDLDEGLYVSTLDR